VIARWRYEVTLAGLLHAVTKTQTLGQHLPDDKTRAGLKAGALPGKAGAASHPAYGSDTVKDVDRCAIAAPPGKPPLAALDAYRAYHSHLNMLTITAL